VPNMREGHWRVLAVCTRRRASAVVRGARGENELSVRCNDALVQDGRNRQEVGWGTVLFDQPPLGAQAPMAGRLTCRRNAALA